MNRRIVVSIPFRARRDRARNPCRGVRNHHAHRRHGRHRRQERRRRLIGLRHVKVRRRCERRRRRVARQNHLWRGAIIAVEIEEPVRRGNRHRHRNPQGSARTRLAPRRRESAQWGRNPQRRDWRDRRNRWRGKRRHWNRSQRHPAPRAKGRRRQGLLAASWTGRLPAHVKRVASPYTPGQLQSCGLLIPSPIATSFDRVSQENHDEP